MSGSGLLGGVGLEWALWCDDDMTDNAKSPQLQQSETEIYVIGDNKTGQLGLGECEPTDPERRLEHQHTLRRIEDASAYVVGVRCAENQTVLRTFDGTILTCGENEHMNQGLSEEVVEQGEAVFRLERVEIQEPAWVLTGSPQAVREAEARAKQLEGWVAADEARLASTANPATAAALQRRLEERREQLQAAQAQLRVLRTKKIKDWKIKEVRTSGQHALAISTYGDVFGWGDGTEGQLGYVGTSAERHAPQHVRTPERDMGLAPLDARNINPEERRKAKKANKDVTITSVACGAMHSALLTLTGQVWVQGLNSYGQLGHGSKSNHWKPVRVQALAQTTVKQVSCGFYHTAFLTEARELYLCGLNNNGQLGLGFEGEDGAAWADTDRVQEEPKINTFFDSSHGVTQVACGGFHTAVLCNGGELYTFGDGREYQLGHGDAEDLEDPTLLLAPEGSTLACEHIVSVECGQWCTAAVCLSGQVYEWGSCREQSIKVPTPLGAAPGDCAPPPELRDRLAVSIGLGDQHCVVLCVAEPGAYHQAAQRLLGALMDTLHDVHKIKQYYYQPLLDKLNLAKPLMSRMDLDLVFSGCDELQEVLDMSLTRISRELHAGPHGKGWDAIYHDFIGQGVWGRLNELYRVYADSHKDRIRRLRNCKASTSGLRKFIKTAQADSGANLEGMLEAILYHPEHLVEAFEALKELSPNNDSAKDEECKYLAVRCRAVAAQLKKQRLETECIERAMTKLATNSICALPMGIIFGLVLLLAFPWRFYSVIQTWNRLRDRRRIQHDSASGGVDGGHTPRTPRHGGLVKENTLLEMERLASGRSSPNLTRGSSTGHGMARSHLKRSFMASSDETSRNSRVHERMIAHLEASARLETEQETVFADETSPENKQTLNSEEAKANQPAVMQRTSEAVANHESGDETPRVLDSHADDNADAGSFNGAGQRRQSQTSASAGSHASLVLVVMCGVVEAVRDVQNVLLLVLNVFGREALSDLGPRLAAAFSVFFAVFPPLWYFVLGHGGLIGKAVFEAHGNCTYVAPINGSIAQAEVVPTGRVWQEPSDGCNSVSASLGLGAETLVLCNGLCVVRSSCEKCTWPNSTSIEPVAVVDISSPSLCTNYTNVTQAATDGVPGVLSCGWASFWHIYWFSLFYGLCFLAVLTLLLGRWVHLDAMYDCPCYGAEIRQTWANRMAIYSMIAGYYAFFNVSLNINNMPETRPWPYKDQMSAVFPRELFAFWKAPCSDPSIVGAGASTFVGWVCNDFFGTIQEYQLIFLTGLWAASFQLACELPSGKLDDFITYTLVPFLADAMYMVILQACLDTADCTRQNDGSFRMDSAPEVVCFTSETQANGSSAHNGKLLFAMWSFGLYFPVATTSGVLMQPDDPSLDVNTKPIWDITLKLGEFFLVMANVFFSTQPALCCGLNLFANTVFLVVHNVPADTRCLKWLKAQRSVNPPSSSKFINYLASLLLCCGWWSTFCSIIVLSREAMIESCTGKALDPITTPSCQVALESAGSRSADNVKACPAGCKMELEADFMPLICLMVGVLTLILLHLVAYMVATSDRYVTKALKEQTVKKWLSLHSGTASLHATAVEQAEENAEHAARVLLARTQMRYRLFPDHGSAAANNVKKMLARSAAGAFAQSLENHAAYLTENEAFCESGILKSGFSKSRNIWHAAYVCESTDSGEASAEHVVKFSLKKDGRLGGHLDLMGRRDGRVEIVGRWTQDALEVEVQCGKSAGQPQGLFGETQNYHLRVASKDGRGTFRSWDGRFRGRIRWTKRFEP